MMIRKIVLTLAALSFPLLTLAAPAPWYLWQSKVDGKLACSQFSLGPGWVQFSNQPYKDAGCTKPGRPG
ncbi:MULTISPECIES: hypothetical protein [Chromobacterium]|uniref:Secreted protein n=1 Tax=Chromobacterium aquaticum TaxID=467180 RepID=A0ABV8ZQU3_9NEIS|nr:MULTISPECIES: hypothetical protein [Chromobacterium]MCD5362843.1 hypothetical protein [Chromobacterium aquaticum]